MTNPPIRVVSTLSDEEVKKRAALAKKNAEQQEAVYWLKIYLRETGANFLRIVRGGGSPADLSRNCENCINGFQRFFAAHNRYPFDSEIRQFLDCELTLRENRPWISKREPERALRQIDKLEMLRQDAHLLIRSGCLQVAASLLMDQMTQRRKGESEISEGVKDLIRIRSELKKLHAVK
jgi:hypothetical protein